jgi:iron complex transport system permease protein
MMGGGLVLLSDLVGRLVRHPFEIPAATIFGVLGALLFLWLLYFPPKSKGAACLRDKERAR